MLDQKRKYSIFSSIAICVRCSPVSAITMILLYFMQGLTPALLTLSTGAFIDAAIGLLESHHYQEVLKPLAFMMVLISYDWISSQLINLLTLKLQISVREKFSVEVVEKVSRLNYRYIENPDSWNLITKVSGQTEESVLNAFQALLSFGSLLQKIAGLFLVLFRYAPVSSLIVMTGSVPLVYLSLKGGRDSYFGISATQSYRRRYEYLSKVLTGREAAEERTLFGFSAYLNHAWDQAYETWRVVNAKINIRNFIKAKASSIALVLIAILVMFVLIPETIAQTLTIGIFMALVSNIFALVQLMSWNLSSSVSEIAKYHGFFQDVRVFSRMEEIKKESGSWAPEKFSSLEFKNVTFAYPGTERKILNNISFRIERGNSYSFVGANGSGKSTITKLMAGLYDNYEGDIFINGRNIRGWSQEKISSFFSLVYQDFARYGISFLENIAVGSVDALMKQNLDQARLQEVIHMMDLEDVVRKLKYGMETSLGKMKRDSEDLSGGQWQRVAIARGLFNPRPVKILDEPTAALDPIAESALYEKFQMINQENTSITISHRLASAKQTDVIFVIGQGTVLGEGSHEFLYENNSLYRQMYDSQRSWYTQ